MTANEISDLAKTNQPISDLLPLVYQQLYYVLRGIYRGYDAGEMTVEEAKQAKTNAIRQFEIEELSYKMYTETAKRRAEISAVLSKCDKCKRRKSCECEQCKQISRIFDGRQRTNAEETDNAAPE